jgi:alkanesulfonate monooxygenase SsuD/methylene tetrahydromethanopterin reductase-like flavin-dependent oxidoreductase (luciferase family)
VPTFDPTRPPAGRLARLGIVLDAATPEDTVRLARLCDRAGIDAVWIADRVSLTGDPAFSSAWLVAEAVAGHLRRSRLGVVVDEAGPEPTTEPPSLDGPSEVTAPAHSLGARRPSESGPRRLGAIVEDMATVASVLDVADDIVLPGWVFTDLETAADEVRATAADRGRDPATLGVAALLPVSIGRTRAEAEARADADPAFGRFGHAAEIGIFGTLEECQDRVIALAHAGVADLRCLLPVSVDSHDVIAQLTAITVGTTAVLVPGSLRSPAPAPPEGWGGRPDQPPAERISGGSRRR